MPALDEGWIAFAIVLALMGLLSPQISRTKRRIERYIAAWQDHWIHRENVRIQPPALGHAYFDPTTGEEIPDDRDHRPLLRIETEKEV